MGRVNIVLKFPPKRLKVWVIEGGHDIPSLVASRLLKSLGNPSANGTKYFATADLLEIAKDHSWLVSLSRWPRPSISIGRKKRSEADHEPYTRGMGG